MPTNVYGNESSQTIGDNNKCPTQFINSDGNRVTCKIYINHPEATSSVNQQNIPRTATPPSADGQEDKFISIVTMPSPPTQSLLK